MRLDGKEVSLAEFKAAHERNFALLLPTMETIAREHHLDVSHSIDRDPLGPHACFFFLWRGERRTRCFIRICAQDPFEPGPNFRVEAIAKHYSRKQWDYCIASGMGVLRDILTEAVQKTECVDSSFAMEAPRKPRGSPIGVLLFAATAGKKELLMTLVAEGVDVNAVGRRGMTALHWAATAGQQECAEFLLERDAVVNVKTDVGITPLMEAVCNGHCEIVTLLLAAGAEVNVRAEDAPRAYWRAGRTALGMAQASEYLPKLEEGQRQRKIIAILEQAGAQV